MRIDKISPTLSLLLLLSLSGCFYIGENDYDDILKKPYKEWTQREDLTVILSCMKHNIFDFSSNIKVYALPYYPAVLVASIRVWEDRKPVGDVEFVSDADALAKANAGLYIDWSKSQFVDGKGNYFKGALQLDSLMFMIHMENLTNPFAITMDPERGPYPDISNLEQKIYLVNDKEKFIRPRYVWGKRNNFLSLDETLLAMFPLRKDEHHFLEGSEHMYLVIKEPDGPGTDIKLTFDLSKIR